MAEMTLAGKLLGANVALIAGFHTLRAVAVNLLAIPIWKGISPKTPSNMNISGELQPRTKDIQNRQR